MPDSVPTPPDEPSRLRWPNPDRTCPYCQGPLGSNIAVRMSSPAADTTFLFGNFLEPYNVELLAAWVGLVATDYLNKAGDLWGARTEVEPGCCYLAKMKGSRAP